MENQGVLFPETSRGWMESHLSKLKLSPDHIKLLMRVMWNGSRKGSLTVVQLSLKSMAEAIGRSRSFTVDIRDDLVRLGFLSTSPPPVGRTLLTLCNWSKIVDRTEPVKLKPGLEEWLEAAGFNDPQNDPQHDPQHDPQNDPPDSPLQKEGGKESILPSTLEQLPELPNDVWLTESDARLNDIVLSWWRRHDLTAAGWKPGEVLGSILATRRRSPTHPEKYFRTALANLDPCWIKAAERFISRQDHAKTGGVSR